MARRVFACMVVAAVCLVLPRAAAAQSVGIGPRVSFVRANSSSATPATRLFGGTLRLMTGGHTALEGTMDYRSYLSTDGTERTREVPVQGSLLLFVSRSAFAPYVAGGIGMYSQVRDKLNSTGLPVASVADKRVGWHVGIGAEIKMAPHAALFLDYRLRFVKFGDTTSPDAEPINIPIVDSVKVTHEGSMWSSGMAFYF